jgi:hypothetical protein
MTQSPKSQKKAPAVVTTLETPIDGLRDLMHQDLSPKNYEEILQRALERSKRFPPRKAAPANDKHA